MGRESYSPGRITYACYYIQILLALYEMGKGVDGRTTLCPDGYQGGEGHEYAVVVVLVLDVRGSPARSPSHVKFSILHDNYSFHDQ